MENPEPPRTVFRLKTVHIELRGDELVINPSRFIQGAEVVISAGRLERWAERIYREEVFNELKQVTG